MATMLMSQEVLKSLESIANSSFALLSTNDLEKLDLNILNSFNEKVPPNFKDLKIFIRREFNNFQSWVGSIRNIPQPIFLPKNFITELLTEIKSQLSVLKDANFFVYIDEYENLLVEQQRLINTWLKHSEVPLIFNIAMKRNSFTDKKTVGNEQLSDIHDYREYDLESYYDQGIDFELFAAEILFLRLWKNDNKLDIPITIKDLRDTSENILQKRRSSEYKNTVKKAANKLLPGITLKNASNEVFKDATLLKRYKTLLREAIEVRTKKPKEVDVTFEKLYLENHPEAALIIPSLLARNIQTEVLIEQIEKLKSGDDNNFTGKTSWVHNNLWGCLLLIYEPLGRVCPVYSGFDSFCLLSKTNLRHFLELCFKSITNEHLINNGKTFTEISIKSQAEAAKQASTSFLKEIKSFGNNGNSLHTFVMRIGTYFKYAHKRLAQSESEQNHFGIKGTITDETLNFLEDAIKWSVLYENKITKQKGGKNKLETEDFEYILNPIYAPYFHISFRKKRRVDFDIKEFNSIAFGNFEDFQFFLDDTLKKWKLKPNDNEINLFSEISDIS